MVEKITWQKALDEFVQTIKKNFNKEIDSIILYGSRARGDAEVSSDIDLLIVLNDSVEIRTLEREIDKIASELSLKYNVVISLVYLHKSRFEQRFEPLLINIKKEGLKVA